MDPIHVYADGAGHQGGATNPVKEISKLINHNKNSYCSLLSLNAQYLGNLTTNLKLLCFGNRAFLKYCGVSRYRKIRIRKAAPLSFSSELASGESDSPLLSNTTTCVQNNQLWIKLQRKKRFRWFWISEEKDLSDSENRHGTSYLTGQLRLNEKNKK